MRGVVLLSGGLDSLVAAFLAAREMTLALALTADYGQRAAACEIRAARRVAAALGIPHTVVPLEWVGHLAPNALTAPGGELPHLTTEELDTPVAEAAAAAVWVPNRNGLLVNVAAVYAETLDCQAIICGFNREEAATFPDNSPAYVDMANAALALSTRTQVQVLSPTLHLSKAEIVRRGREVGAPLDLVWSCYEAGPVPCGRCASCLRLQRALENA